MMKKTRKKIIIFGILGIFILAVLVLLLRSPIGRALLKSKSHFIVHAADSRILYESGAGVREFPKTWPSRGETHFLRPSSNTSRRARRGCGPGLKANFYRLETKEATLNISRLLCLKNSIIIRRTYETKGIS